MLIASAYRSIGPTPKTANSRSHQGINLGRWGVLIGALGWSVGVFVSQIAGFAVVAFAFLVGFAGILVHFAIVFRKRDKDA